MKTEATVIALNMPAARRRGSLPLPAPLESIRDLALAQLRQGMQALFDEVDDALFDLADRAGDNQEQGLYYDAMRDLRLKRQGIERTFLDRCACGFEALLADGPEVAAASHMELEAQVADSAMVAKAQVQVGGGLERLSTGLGAMLDREISGQANPLGPRAVCGYFAEAFSEVEMDIRIKLMVLKLFERHCLGGLAALYEDACRQLGVSEREEMPARPSEPVAREEAAVAPVSRLRVGSWLELSLEGEQKLRCKLAAFIRHTGRYIFVNRSGAKVLEKTDKELAADLAAGAVRLLDDALIFDRALESVINLRRVTAEQS